MHTATVSAPLRPPRVIVWAWALALLVALTAAATGVAVGRPDLGLPASGAPSGGVRVGFVLAPVLRGVQLAQVPPAVALGASMACRGSRLAARARALEFDPVR